MMDNELPPILNAADLMKPPSKNVLKVIRRNFTQLGNDIVTFTALPETSVLMSKLAVKSGINTQNYKESLSNAKTVELLLESATSNPKAFRKIMETNDQLFLHVIKGVSPEDLKHLIDSKIFTSKELIVLAKKHIPWVAERGHWVRKNYGEELIFKIMNDIVGNDLIKGVPRYELDDKEYGLNYFVESGRRAWIEKNYGVEIAEKALKRYGDRVPDSVDFIEGIVDKINGVVTNNSPTAVA